MPHCVKGESEGTLSSDGPSEADEVTASDSVERDNILAEHKAQSP